MKPSILNMKKWTALTALVLLVLLPALACADDAGVLSEGELNTWVMQVLRDSANETPMNAPVGEESLTEDGYAFIYSFATLYYNKPEMNQQSVLKAVTLTDSAYAAPRGLKVGDDASLLIENFGWQNPTLLGNASFAALYVLDQLPENAYWSWAQREDGAIASVRCAIHVKTGDDRYTDAGVTYTTEDGKIDGIQVYGLDRLVTEREVRNNLNAVNSVEADITGDDHDPQYGAVGYYQLNAAAPFAADDLLFGGVDYMNLDEAAATALFGAALSEEKVKDDTGAWLVTTQRNGLTLSYTVSEDGAHTTLDSMSVSGPMAGPRGIQVGMTAADVLKLFYSDGAGTVLGSVNVLYGDGDNAPTGIMERDGDVIYALRYRALAPVDDGERSITLHMTFEGGQMAEWMIYSW